MEQTELMQYIRTFIMALFFIVMLIVMIMIAQQNQANIENMIRDNCPGQNFTVGFGGLVGYIQPLQPKINISGSVIGASDNG